MTENHPARKAHKSSSTFCLLSSRLIDRYLIPGLDRLAYQKSMCLNPRSPTRLQHLEAICNKGKQPFLTSSGAGASQMQRGIPQVQSTTSGEAAGREDASRASASVLASESASASSRLLALLH
jgi:hypothetical protein